MLNVHSFTFNPFQENTWIIWSEQGNCLIVDPGCYTKNEKEELSDFITTKNLNPIRLINTHCHIDHVLGNPFVFENWNLQPEIHPAEQNLLDAVDQYGKMWGIESDPQPTCLHTLFSEKFIQLDGETIEILFTPGHSPGEVSLYYPKGNFLIAGDVLFLESIGRTDLPGGNFEVLKESIMKLYLLPDETLVHPGHGPSTSIGHEKDFNPFVKYPR